MGGPDSGGGGEVSAELSAELDAALALLGVTRSSAWTDVRTAYRTRLREVHPDLGADGAATTARCADLNMAWELVLAATEGGRRPLPAAPPALPRPQASRVTLHARPGDVFVQLLDAAYEVGDVVYIDPEAGLISVLVDADLPSASQLLIQVATDDDPPAATFTLDSTNSDVAPDIGLVVDRVAVALARPSSH